MKKAILMSFLVALTAALCLACPAVAEPSAEQEAEWTVMFYLCGSDLESKYGYATGNLEEIMGCFYPPDFWELMRHGMDEGGGEWASDRVNVVLETGGCEEWHAQALGMDISTDRLQRWRLKTSTPEAYMRENEIALEETLPLQSMADPDTLSDFIRWSAENYPAKKYALVLWDHGSGCRGLFIDELFDGDTMALDELKTALSDGGVDFEAVLFDACLMANLETACAIKDNARWMVASEEVVAGKGTAMGSWLQQLFTTPRCDGERLGRWVCEMSQIKYAEENDEQSQQMLTWSVIDLSKIDRVAAALDRFFEDFGECYASYPLLASDFSQGIEESEEFGSGLDNMYDLAGVFYGHTLRDTLEINLKEDALDALTDAVTYTARGAGRSAARGLSFCWASDFKADELDAYARCCPSAHYLALLDAINPGWEAPEWVYQQAAPLPDIRELEVYRVSLVKAIMPDGTPGVGIGGGFVNLNGIFADLYRLNEATGQTVRLGSTMAYMAETSDESADGLQQWSVYEPWTWPAVEGVICDAEYVSGDLLGYKILINIPAQIDGENCILRCGYDDESEAYTIYGVWQGYDADTSAFDRNVKSLAQLAGQNFSLLYPVEGTAEAGSTRYELSPALTMYRALQVEEQTLPEGTYYLDYWVKNMFMRRLPVGRVEMYWDGERLSFPGDEPWEGEVTLIEPEE